MFSCKWHWWDTVILVQRIRLFSILLNRFLDKMGDAIIQFSTTYLQNVLPYVHHDSQTLTPSHWCSLEFCALFLYQVVLQWLISPIEQSVPSQQLHWTVLNCPGMGWPLQVWQAVLVRIVHDWNQYLEEFCHCKSLSVLCNCRNC